MVVTANPLASRAGCDVLKAGGTAADAAVAVQAVLGLVEPQSSGLGGGAFMLYYDAKTKVGRQLRRPRDRARRGDAELPALGRRRHRPDRAQAERARERPLDRHAGRRPHARPRPQGARPDGVERSDAARHPARDRRLSDQRPARARRSRERGPTCSPTPRPPRPTSMPNLTSKAVGTTLKIPAYAATLTGARRRRRRRALHRRRSRRRSSPRSAPRPTRQTGAAITPGKTTLADLADYQAKRREAVCTTYRAYWVCGMGPPSSGGIAVAQTLGILENFNLGLYRADHARHRGRQALGVRRPPRQRGRAARLRGSRQVRRRHRLRLAAWRHLGHDAQQALPAQPRRPDQLHDEHGDGAAGQPRPGAARRREHRRRAGRPT